MAEYIDRDAVLWDLNHLWDWDSVDGITARTVLKQVITDVKNVPAADVRENKKGKWLVDSPYVRCSSCNYINGVDEIEIYVDKKLIMPNFCPYCGADMRCGTQLDITTEDK